MTKPGVHPLPYRPIPCAQHDVYEIAILHHQYLHLVWSVGDTSRTGNCSCISSTSAIPGGREEVVMPVDLQTHQGEEFLLARSPTGEVLKIRLDYIRQANPV